VRLVYLITALDAGGAQRAMLKLLPALRRSCALRIVCLFEGPGQVVPQVERLGIPWTSLGMRSKLDAGVVLRLARLLRREAPDALVTSLFHATLAGRLAGRLAGVPRILSWAHSAHLAPHRAAIERVTGRLSHVLLADSPATRRYLEARLRLPPRRIRVVPISAIDPADFPPRGPAPARDRLTVGSVGMLYPAKGYLQLVRAAARVAEERAGVQFLVAGEGPERGRLSGEIGRRKLADVVRLAGYVEDVAAFHRGLHLYVQPSLWEGFCIGAVEAMASALPVVASRVGGLAESVLHGRTGLLVEPDQPEKLAGAILALLSDPERAAAMGAAGREAAVARHTAEAMVERFLSVLQEREETICVPTIAG